MAKKLPIWDQRMFALMEYVISNKLKSIELKQDFLKAVKCNHLSAITAIRNGDRSFTLENLHEAGKQFNISMEWFFGFTDNMKRDNKTDSVEELLQQALSMLKSKQ